MASWHEESPQPQNDPDKTGKTRRFGSKLRGIKARIAEELAMREKLADAAESAYKEQLAQTESEGEKTYWAEIQKDLVEFSGRVVLISNFYGEDARAETIARSFSEKVPKNTRVGFSVHLNYWRIDDGVGDVVGKFESNVSALISALKDEGFSNIEDLDHTHTLITEEGLTAKTLAEAARDTKDGPVQGEDGYIHMAIVSALESKKLGLPYDARGGAHILSGFNQETGIPEWAEIDSLHITHPAQWMAQIAIEANDTIKEKGLDGTPEADALMNVVDEIVDDALHYTGHPLANDQAAIRDLPETPKK